MREVIDDPGSTPDMSPVEGHRQAGSPLAGHTPGPWVVVGRGVLEERDPGHNASIAICDAYAGAGDANARLIAAAPEMLSALRRAQAAIDEAGQISPDWEVIMDVSTDVDAAIQKATTHD